MLRSTISLLALSLAACDAAPKSDSTGESSAPAAPVSRTIALFDGETLDGWHPDVPAADDGAEVEPSFVVRDGLLVSRGRPLGHLITDDAYGDYRLEVEYRWPGGTGNCGVLVHASDPRALYGMFPRSLEVQLQHGSAGDFWCIGENISVPDMAERRSGAPETWGGGPDQSRHIRNLTDDSENAPGEWNTLVVECTGDEIDVWVNGDRVNHGFDCTVSEGAIALQAEGAEVEFRRIDLTPIGG